VLVSDERGLSRLERVLLGGQGSASVVLTRSRYGSGPVLPLQDIRAVLGVEPRIYFVSEDRLLSRLRVRLGSALAVNRGAVRIFWPGLALRSDSLAHPLVPVLDDEPLERSLAELARRFDLSRPTVRSEIRLIEDARTALAVQVADLTRELAAITRSLHEGQRG
jgi:hypothetical protein